jgi:hypothetical protein
MLAGEIEQRHLRGVEQIAADLAGRAGKWYQQADAVDARAGLDRLEFRQLDRCRDGDRRRYGRRHLRRRRRGRYGFRRAGCERQNRGEGDKAPNRSPGEAPAKAPLAPDRVEHRP